MFMLAVMLILNIAYAGNTPMKPMLTECIKKVNNRLTDTEAESISQSIYQYSAVWSLNPRLVAAVIAVESGFDPKATGKLGEVGLMQLHPKYHAADYSIAKNLAVGIKYLAGIKTVFEKRYPGVLWLELYNRGPNKTPKTFPYVKKVIKFYSLFTETKDGSKEVVQLSER